MHLQTRSSLSAIAMHDCAEQHILLASLRLTPVYNSTIFSQQCLPSCKDCKKLCSCPFFQKHQQVEQHYLNEEPSDSRLEPGGQAMLNPCELWSYRPTPSFCLCILGSSNFSLSAKTFVERKKSFLQRPRQIMASLLEISNF